MEKNEAEKLVVNLAVKGNKNIGLEEIILIFYKTKNIYKQALGYLQLCAFSDRPNYQTSDDALVNLFTKSKTCENVLIVTSDTGLQKRQKDIGFKVIMKSGSWFKLIKDRIGEETYIR